MLSFFLNLKKNIKLLVRKIEELFVISFIQTTYNISLMSYPKTLSIWCRNNSPLSYKYAAMQMRVILCNHFAWKVFQRCCILKGPQTWTRALLVFPLVIYLQKQKSDISLPWKISTSSTNNFLNISLNYFVGTFIWRHSI